MSNVFNPFDERHREKRKRRTAAQVAEEKSVQDKIWMSRIRDQLRRTIAEMGDPEAIQGAELMSNFSSAGPIGSSILRRHCGVLMASLGYKILQNPKSVDGRWRWGARRYTVYTKGGKNFSRSELSERLGLWL